MNVSTSQEEEALLIERIERALILLAYFIELDGDVHLAMFERFESELEVLKKRQATRELAAALLEAYRCSNDVESKLFQR